MVDLRRISKLKLISDVLKLEKSFSFIFLIISRSKSISKFHQKGTFVASPALLAFVGICQLSLANGLHCHMHCCGFGE